MLNFHIANRDVGLPQIPFPSASTQIHTFLRGSVHLPLWRYPVAVIPQSFSVFLAVPSGANRLWRTPQIVPGHVGRRGSDGLLSGKYIPLAKTIPTRAMSTTGMSDALFFIDQME